LALTESISTIPGNVDTESRTAGHKLNQTLSERKLTINARLILIVREVIFYAGETHNWRFRRVFRGGQDFFEPQMVLRAAKGNFGFKKVETPSKKPREFADYVLCQHTKNNITNY
jgi:hypothetical protein